MRFFLRKLLISSAILFILNLSEAYCKLSVIDDIYSEAFQDSAILKTLYDSAKFYTKTDPVLSKRLRSDARRSPQRIWTSGEGLPGFVCQEGGFVHNLSTRDCRANPQATFEIERERNSASDTREPNASSTSISFSCAAGCIPRTHSGRGRGRFAFCRETQDA